jgi:beta-lactamase class A
MAVGQSTGLTGVTAEAIDGAVNLRSEPNTEADIIGEIAPGTRYPVVGRSDLAPWVLLGDVFTLQPIGWAFQDIVRLYGPIENVPFTNVSVTPGGGSQPATSGGGLPAITAQASLTPSATATFAVAGLVQGEINIRYGPGTEYERLGVARAGDRFEITGYHTQFPWVQIRYPASPNGFAWVASDLLVIEGDIYTLPPIAQTSFNLPTLTPTPPVIRPGNLPGQDVPLSEPFLNLGNQLWDLVLSSGFDPATSRLGALYVQDMQTGEAMAFGGDIAFSGTSISKIAILTNLFAVLNDAPNVNLAIDIANTMICSENFASNRLLGIIGEGDQLEGANRVSAFLREMGLQNSFLAAPFDTTTQLTTPTPVVSALTIPPIQATQTLTQPDPVNQLTVSDVGYILGAVYQCAVNESGPLMDAFPGQYTAQECQRIIHVMSNNIYDTMLRAGVPENIRVAHKHGWIVDTHSNAALIFTPGGDYVVVMALHQATNLNYQDSLPLIAEVSRRVFNFYNPQQPLEAIRDGYIPPLSECVYNGNTPLVVDLASPGFALDLRPAAASITATPTATLTPTSP